MRSGKAGVGAGLFPSFFAVKVKAGSPGPGEGVSPAFSCLWGLESAAHPLQLGGLELGRRKGHGRLGLCGLLPRASVPPEES